MITFDGNGMKRICILGCCGAGKSTLAKKLQKITRLELIHLDQYYWKPNWVESSKTDWEKTHHQLIQKPSWIIDGNYGGTMDTRMSRADTIVYMDFPTWKCIFRVFKRIRMYKGRARPDMNEGCLERFDFEFLHFVATFNLRNRKRYRHKLNVVKSEKSIFILRNDNEVIQFLNRIQSIFKN